MNNRRISKNLMTELEEIVFTMLPFLLFIIFYMHFAPFKGGWNLWFSNNRILAFIFLVGAIIWLIFKYYYKHYFFVWAGFAIYFSLSFIFQSWSPRSFGHYGYDFWYRASTFLPVHGLSSEFKYPVHIFPNLNIFILFLSLLLLVGLFTYLKIESNNKIIFIICYYFVYCFFLFLQYMPRITSSEHFENAFKSFIIFNSIITGIVIYLVARSKKIIFTCLLLAIYFILNFITINIYRIKDIYVNKNYFIIGNSQFNEMLQIIMLYFNYFLIFSNILYLIVIIYGIEFIKKNKKSVVAREID